MSLGHYFKYMVISFMNLDFFYGQNIQNLKFKTLGPSGENCGATFHEVFEGGFILETIF